MRKILFILSLSYCFTAYAQNLNFADSKFKALILSSTPTNEIAKDINGNAIAIDANGDGEIQVSEAQQVAILTIKQNENLLYIDPDGDHYDSSNINFPYYFSHLPDNISDALLFTNLEELYISDTKNANISFVNNTKIKKVMCINRWFHDDGSTNGNLYESSFFPVDFTIDNCPSILTMDDISAYYHPDFLGSAIFRIKNNPQFNGSLVLNNKMVTELYFENINLTSININDSRGLEKLSVPNIATLQTINITNTQNWQSLNQKINLIANNCSALQEIILDGDYYDNQAVYLSAINVNGNVSLKKIKGLNAPNINFSTAGLINLEELDCSYYNRYIYDTTGGVVYGNLNSLNLSGLPNLKILKAFNQPITNNVNFSAASNLENIDITNSCGYMNTVDISNLAHLHSLKSDWIHIYSNDGNIDLQKIIAKNCISLNDLMITGNFSLKELNLENCASLQALHINSPMSSYGNTSQELNSLNVKQCPSLEELAVSNTKITTLDTSGCTALKDLEIEENSLLSQINIRNGSIEQNVHFISYNPNLSVCVDDAQIAGLQTEYPDISFSTNCNTSYTTTWDGTNWSNGAPSATADAIFTGSYSTTLQPTFVAKNIIIQNGGILEITSGNTITAANVAVQDGGNLIQKDGSTLSYTGTFKVLKNGNSAQNKYAFWSSPVSSQDLTKIYGNGNNPQFVTEYNTATDYFVNAISTTSIFGKGYSIKTPAVSNVTFEGTPNNGTQTFTLNTTGNGFNLTGNPYPSNLNLNTFYNNNSTRISNTFYFWDNTSGSVTTQGGTTTTNIGYSTYNPLTSAWVPAPNISTVPTGVVANIGQGFIVQSLSSSIDPSLTFTNDMRTATDGSFFNKNNTAGEGKFWLRLNSSYNTNNTFAVAYLNGASDSFDNYDSKAIAIGSDAFYTLADAQKLVIQGKEIFDVDDVVPVGTKHFESGDFTISLVQKEGIFTSGQPIYLHDKTNGTYTDLQNGAYTFTANAGESTDRFEIVYKLNVLSTIEAKKDAFEVYRNGENFFVRNDKNIEKVEVYDAAGRKVQTIESNSKLVKISLTGKGIYILKATSAGKEYTKKVIK